MNRQETILPTHFAPRVPIVGTLKIGELEEGGKRPKKLDYMRLCMASATGDNRYLDHPDMVEFNKSKSKSLTIELVSEDPRINLEIVYAMGGNGFILCRGNGVEAERRINNRNEMVPDAVFKPVGKGVCGDGCPFFQAGKCKLASTLYFRIPGKTAIGSVWQFRTTSWNTAQDLLGAMNSLKALTGGILSRIPFNLFMTEQRRRPVVGNGRTTSHFWTLGLAFQGEEEELIKAVSRAKSCIRGMAELSIPSVEDRLKDQQPGLLSRMSETEEKAFSDEFFPPDESKTSDLPISPVNSPEWTDEQREAAKAQLASFGDHLYSLGLEPDGVEEELGVPRNLIGDLGVSYETWDNRISARWERVTKKYAKTS